ncbi:P27 family phage terminase small subunit [Microbacterium sp. SD291]|uniref:P27 family phage terminase small subunit n=1 Tax=Microbacterium sp. SD291 TaxID=2782007 RepID=UPI001A973235|nr:P27 family phage terminase small subunit [Microbacterium sp. SD291]MBO0979896.1 hypothetical protein [Microbacterium sp. SD291]
MFEDWRIMVVPSELKKRGRALWAELHERLEFDPHEDELVLEVCRAVDTIDALAETIEQDGVTSTGSMGQTVVHPAIPELRQQQAGLSRLVATLNLSDAMDGSNGQVALSRAISSQAQAAANARWAKSKRARGA